jgi:CDP-diacylglycerol--glycerol-3-phosphate 3-phosphatidyltransferase
MIASEKFNQFDEVKRSKVNAASTKMLTLSNALSLLRIVLFLPFVYFYERDEKNIAFVIVLIAISTDWFDGRVARWTNTVSELGKILDPLADKVSAALMGLYLLYRGELPWWFVAIVVTRDIIIFWGGVYIKQKKTHHYNCTTDRQVGSWVFGRGDWRHYLSVSIRRVEDGSGNNDLHRKCVIYRIFCSICAAICRYSSRQACSTLIHPTITFNFLKYAC